jgi:hypothetical protein
MTNSFSGFDDFADDLDDLASSLDRAADRIDAGEATSEGSKKTAEKIADVARMLAPVYDGDNPTNTPGELRESISVEAPEGDDEDGWLVTVSADHAKPIEYGAAPHIITSNGSYPLTFKVDGKWVSTHVVNHPGNEAQPYLRPAMDEHERELAQAIFDEIERIIDEEVSSYR